MDPVCLKESYLRPHDNAGEIPRRGLIWLNAVESVRALEGGCSGGVSRPCTCSSNSHVRDPGTRRHLAPRRLTKQTASQPVEAIAITSSPYGPGSKAHTLDHAGTLYPDHDISEYGQPDHHLDRPWSARCARGLGGSSVRATFLRIPSGSSELSFPLIYQRLSNQGSLVHCRFAKPVGRVLTGTLVPVGASSDVGEETESARLEDEL
ncbi:hypothetical protein VTK56DRAFT_8916 [Thermocarpiscus australiensis]